MFLIVGCGYIGERVADMLHQQGHRVVAATHSMESARRLDTIKPYPVHPLDITQPKLPDPWPKLQDEILCVLHCASTNRGGPQRAVEVYQDGSKHLVQNFPKAIFNFVSSTSLYTQTDGSWVTEDTPTTSAVSVSAQALLAAETIALHANGFAGRLGGIYGPHRSYLLKNFLEGAASIEGTEPNDPGRVINQIHREDAASALVLLLMNKRQGIYNIVDDTPMTQRECFSELARRFDRPLPPVSPPNHQRKRPFTNKRISNARICELNWHPKYPSYFDALDQDPELVPSILAQVANPSHCISGHEH